MTWTRGRGAAGVWRGGGTLLACVVIASCSSLSAAAKERYGEATGIACEGGACMLGGAGPLVLPATVRIRTASNTYLSATPPVGGSIVLSDSAREWEVWRMETVGDKVAFKSAHGTYLSEKWAPCDGFDLTGERLSHELFEIENKWSGRVAIKCYNGLYISAYPSKTQWPEGIRQMPFPPRAHEWSDDAWEVWTVESVSEGQVALRSTHGTYLGATAPNNRGTWTQQARATDWETFFVEHVGDGVHVRVRTVHGTYLSSHEDDSLFLSQTASDWEQWVPYVNRSSGAICLQSHRGQFLHPNGAGDTGWRTSPDCLDQELLLLVSL